MKTRRGFSIRRSLFLILIFFGAFFAFVAGSLFSVNAQTGDPIGLSSVSSLKVDGVNVLKYNINSPPHPPASFDIQSTIFNAPAPGQFSTYHGLTVPAYNWVFGCSSVSGAMIAGYYDNNGYPNMYVGPTNGGAAPMNNSSWGNWTDSTGHPYPNLPLAASHNGVDGRSSKGSIDDYWASLGSLNDPYITGSWTQHNWSDGTAIGDYMKTSQSAYGNSDGSTSFYVPDDAAPMTCEYMVTHGMGKDGTVGRKLFYEARGYTVTECYAQQTDNQVTGGFSLAQFRAEIDAGRPVMMNLFKGSSGHTVVGVGYDGASTTIYIHDTWDYSDHSMTWGGSYGDSIDGPMDLSSVSIVNLAPAGPPGAFNKINPTNASNRTSTFSLSWQASPGATSYYYCIDQSADTACDTGWINNNASTSVTLSKPLGTYYWQVYAHNSLGDTCAGGGWWSLTVVASVKTYLPVINRQLPPPASFIANGDFEQGSTGWTEYSSQGYYPLIMDRSHLLSGVNPHSGDTIAWLGGVQDEISYIQQKVFINAVSPYLVYWHWIGSEDPYCNDFGGVLINGSVVDSYILCTPAETSGWVKHSVYLGAYAGQSVDVQIRVETDSTLNSNLFVDDVYLSASAAGVAGKNDVAPQIVPVGASKGKIDLMNAGQLPQTLEKRVLPGN